MTSRTNLKAVVAGLPADGSSAGDAAGRRWSYLRLGVLIGAAAVVGGAVWLAIERAPALLLDLAALAGCL